MTRRIGAAMVLLAAAGFGTIAVFGKLGFAAGLNNATMLGFRFPIAAVVLWAVVLARRGLPRVPRRQAAGALGLGVAYTVLTGAFFWGLVYLTAGLAVITLYTYPIYVFIIAVVLLGEAVTRRKLVALLLAIGGVVVIVGLDTSGVDPLGLALVSAAAVAYAVYTTGSRVAVADLNPDVLSTLAMTGAAVLFAGYGLLSGTMFVPSSTDQWGVVIGLALLGTAAPITLFAYGLERVEASRASVLTTAEPPVAVALGVLLLDESLSPGVLVGGAMVLGGIVLIQSERTAAPPAVAPPE
ncbi:MAG: DMT family transporter [Halobacteriales archaeon]